MIKLLIAIISVFAINNASAFELIELDELKIDYYDFFDGGRDPLVTQNGLKDRQLGKELRVNINTNILDVFYWNNIIHSMTDERKDGGGQFRTVGLETKLGMRVTYFLNIEFKHHSQHVLDHKYPYGAFPVNDSIGINLILYSKDRKDSLF